MHAKAGRWERASHLISRTIRPKGKMNTLVQKDLIKGPLTPWKLQTPSLGRTRKISH